MDDVNDEELPPNIRGLISSALLRAADVGLVEITEAGLRNPRLWQELVALREIHATGQCQDLLGKRSRGYKRAFQDAKHR